MKLVKLGLLAAGLLSLTACDPPAISDIAFDKVKVHSEIDDPKAIAAEAERGCAIYKRVPVPVSKRTISSGYEYLFACQDPNGASSTPTTAKSGS